MQREVVHPKHCPGHVFTYSFGKAICRICGHIPPAPSMSGKPSRFTPGLKRRW